MINTQYPAPQADSLMKVITSTDCVAAGATGGETVAEMLGLVGRQGEYYLSAAGYLGLIERLQGESGTTWRLTPAGEDFHKASPGERIEAVKALMSEIEEVQTYVNEGEESLRSLLRRKKLSGDTVNRRVVTIIAWTTAITQPDTAAGDLEMETKAAVARRAGALAGQEVREKAKKEEVRRLAPKPVVTCPEHFMQVLPSGKCPELDCEAKIDKAADLSM